MIRRACLVLLAVVFCVACSGGGDSPTGGGAGATTDGGSDGHGGAANDSGSAGADASGGGAGIAGAGGSAGFAGGAGAPDGGGAGQAGSGGAGGSAGSAGSDGGPASDLPSCTEPTFVDVIAPASWTNLDVTPGGGTAAIRNAIYTARDQHPNEPVRIRLAPGFYADNLGAEMWVQHVLRTSTSPIWIQATDQTPNATRLGQGLNFVGVSYFAFEGLTFGPAAVGAWNGSTHADPQPLAAQAGIHVAGTAKDGGTSAKLPNGKLDATVYGRYEPSHHLLVRKVTIQNIFDPAARDGVTDQGQGMDGIKFNQAEDVWVQDSTVTQVSRHGIDNVGVHRAAFCGNTIAHTGGGLGLEAKGGSAFVVYESNVFYDVRRVELGGEDTDGTYYFSIDGLYDYEAKRVVVRDNLIVDAREAALEFSGCNDCSAVGNTIFYTTAYVVPGLAGGNVYGGDAMRMHDSLLLDSAHGAGSDCISWDASQDDYVYFGTCWGVGSNAPAPVGRTLPTTNVRVQNDAFLSPAGIWGGTDSTIPCPMNPSGGISLSVLALDGNYWWDGARALPDTNHGCPTLAEGSHSTYSTTAPSANPQIGGLTVDPSTMATLRASAVAALTPGAASALLGAAWFGATDHSAYDFLRATRPAAPAIGALERP